MSNIAIGGGTGDDAVENLSRDVIDALEGAYGHQTGLRRNHTKGVGALGHFIGNPEGARYSRSALFSGKKIEVIARFSIAGGDPKVSDKDVSPRGIGLEFRLPGGELHHMTMLHTPMFFAMLPQTFLDKFVALKLDPATGKANQAVFKRFLATHHDNDSQFAFLHADNPPPSYTNCAFFGIHTFRFRDAADKETMVRFRFQPHDGVKHLAGEEIATLTDDFLIPALNERAQDGPVKWDMIVSVGEPADAVDDPTILWPPERHEFNAGTLVLDTITPDPRAGSYKTNFDPLMLSDGIAASNDPILLFRSPSYAISHERRLRELA
uniref:catalase family peroxidase n=1 Tax=Sphingomonas bacterium TaxID=1895847 RepID=UPI002633A3DD|nr:catalase family peroxidase [Sphingomonas bacterium]